MNWNSQHPDEVFAPQAPEPYYELGHKRHSLTDTQYHDYMVLAGKETLKILAERNLDVQDPTEADIEYIKRSIGAARRKVKKLMQWTQHD